MDINQIEEPMTRDQEVAATVAALETDLGITKVKKPRKPRKTKAQREEEAFLAAQPAPGEEPAPEFAAIPIEIGQHDMARVVLAEGAPELAIDVPLNFSPTLDMVAGVPTKVERPDLKAMDWKERQKYELPARPYAFVSKHAYTDKTTGQQMISKKGATAKRKVPDLFDVTETLSKRQARRLRKEAAKIARDMAITAKNLTFREGT